VLAEVRRPRRRAGPGQELLVAFMPWEGYNIEDAIILMSASSRIRRLHLPPHRAHEVDARDHQVGRRGDHEGIPPVGGDPPRPRRARHHPRRPRVGPGDGRGQGSTPKGETERRRKSVSRAIFVRRARESGHQPEGAPRGVRKVIDVKCSRARTPRVAPASTSWYGSTGPERQRSSGGRQLAAAMGTRASSPKISR